MQKGAVSGFLIVIFTREVQLEFDECSLGLSRLVSDGEDLGSALKFKDHALPALYSIYPIA